MGARASAARCGTRGGTVVGTRTGMAGVRGAVAGAMTMVAVLALGGCGDDLGGPGTLDGEVIAPVPVGAVVVELEGRGIVDVTGKGTTRAFWAEVGSAEPSGEQMTVRAVLVADEPGDIDFDVEVEDLGAQVGVTLVSAVDAANQEVASFQGWSAKLRR